MKACCIAACFDGHVLAGVLRRELPEQGKLAAIPARFFGPKEWPLEGEAEARSEPGNCSPGLCYSYSCSSSSCGVWIWVYAVVARFLQVPVNFTFVNLFRGAVSVAEATRWQWTFLGDHMIILSVIIAIPNMKRNLADHSTFSRS